MVVCAAGGMPGDLLKLWRPLDPKGYHVEYGYSCMGYEIAGGLGVKMAVAGSRRLRHGRRRQLPDDAHRDRHLAPGGPEADIVVVDNSGFQCIRGLQMQSGSPAFGNELRDRDAATNRLDGAYLPVDFAQNAASLGRERHSGDGRGVTARGVASSGGGGPDGGDSHPDQPGRSVPGYESWWDVPIAEESGEDGVRAARVSYWRLKSGSAYSSKRVRFLEV